MPLNRASLSFSPTSRPGYMLSMLDPGTRSEATESPEPVRPGNLVSSKLAYGATRSSATDTVPLVVTDPTASTHWSLAGLVSFLESLPWLTSGGYHHDVAFHACSTANCSGSVQAFGLPPEP